MIEVGNIQAELTRVWDSLEGTNKIRACLFNLIVFTQKNERVPYIRTIVQKVIERFPSRVIFITVDKNSKEDLLKASVSVMTGAKGAYDIVCDLIEIEATRTTQDKIPFILLPNFIADLPIYLLWADDPCRDNPITAELENWATRIIFDSETTDNLSRFATTVVESKSQSGSDIADLNWARTESWRELLASTFHSPERIEQLQRTKKLSITYNSHETEFFCHTKTQALYLQSWLCSLLNWPKSRVELTSEKNSLLPPGTIISMDLITTQGEHFSFCRAPASPHQINMILSTPEKCEIPSKYIFTKSQSGLSLVNEIYQSGTSEHFLKCLSMLS
jgi:glucose-6-phosphate dehydrogenase assembly protein OpcA